MTRKKAPYWTNARTMISVRVFAPKLLSRILIFISLALSLTSFFSVKNSYHINIYIHLHGCCCCCWRRRRRRSRQVDYVNKIPFQSLAEHQTNTKHKLHFLIVDSIFRFPDCVAAFSCFGRRRWWRRHETQFGNFVVARPLSTHRNCYALCLLPPASCSSRTQKYFLVFVQFYFRSLCWRQSCHCRCHSKHNQIH